jgi:hypothetical protein
MRAEPEGHRGLRKGLAAFLLAFGGLFLAFILHFGTFLLSEYQLGTLYWSIAVWEALVMLGVGLVGCAASFVLWKRTDPFAWLGALLPVGVAAVAVFVAPTWQPQTSPSRSLVLATLVGISILVLLKLRNRSK